MNLDFDDLNCLIDDSTPICTDKFDGITDIRGKKISVLKLEFSDDLLKLLELPHREAIKFSNSSIRLDENGITIETCVRQQSCCPKEARQAFMAINKLRQRLIRYENVKGLERLQWDTGNSHRERLDNRKTNNYIKAAKYLPDLLRENGEILVKPEERERFAQFQRKYRIQTQWIEYYVLDNSDVLTELGFKRPTERQYKPGRMSARLYELIKDMWFEAKHNKNSLCQWILSCDCSSQLWLALEAILVLQQWNRDNCPKNRYEFYQSEQPILNRLRDYEGIKATLLYSDNEDENLLSLDEAFSFTFIRLLESGVELPPHKAYLDARVGQANQLRKGEKGKRSNRGFGTSR